MNSNYGNSMDKCDGKLSKNTDTDLVSLVRVSLNELYFQV